MKKLTTQILSIILTLSIAFSLAVPAFAASNTSAYQNIAPEDIASIQETYNSLTPEAKKLYNSSLYSDPDAFEFHRPYIDNSISNIPKVSRAAAAANPALSLVNDFMLRIAKMGLPAVVQEKLRMVAASIAADIIDGPLPIGTIMVIVSSASLAVTLAQHWDVVSPEFNKIVKAFQDTFKSAADNIAKVLSDVKSQVVKIYYTDSRLIDNALKNLDKQTKRQGHIKDPKHNWNKIIKGAVTWEKVRDVIENVMKNGSESRYGSAYKRVLRVAGETVTVTFNKINDTLWAISDAWVNRVS